MATVQECVNDFRNIQANYFKKQNVTQRFIVHAYMLVFYLTKITMRSFQFEDDDVGEDAPMEKRKKMFTKECKSSRVRVIKWSGEDILTTI